MRQNIEDLAMKAYGNAEDYLNDYNIDMDSNPKMAKISNAEVFNFSFSLIGKKSYIIKNDFNFRSFLPQALKRALDQLKLSMVRQMTLEILTTAEVDSKIQKISRFGRSSDSAR